jgi:hypothetical protein
MTAQWIRTKWSSSFLAVLGVLLLLGVAAGQSSTAPVLEPLVRGWERHFTITWETWERGNRPVVAGYVINDAGFTAMKVQLLVDGLDGTGQIVNQRVTWLGPALTPGTRAYFEVPAVPGTSQYRVSVFAFDWLQSAQLQTP